jgi:hypothetical protein
MPTKDICKICGGIIETELSLDQIRDFLLKRSMWVWEEYAVGTKVDVEGLGEVEVLHNDYLNVNEEATGIKFVWGTRFGYYAIEGYWSSYSGSEWNRDLLPAEKKTKEVIYFA